MHPPLSRRLTLAVTTALIVAGGGAYALVSSTSAQSQQPSPATQSAAGTFSSLKPFVDGAVRNDTMKLLDSAMVSSSPTLATPANSSRVADTLLTSDGDQVCLVIQVHEGSGSGVGCGPRAGFGTKDLGASLTFLGSHYLVTGAAPDGTRDIVVHSRSGASTAVEAKNNTYSTPLLDSVPARVSWTDAEGAAQQYTFIDPTR